MTIFLKLPPHSEKPRYLLIAEGLSNFIREGKLKPGARLPPHRELADQLKVTVGTVTRAYTEMEKWGLIRGEVGRGTYVRDPETATFRFAIHGEELTGLINLSMNLPAVASAAQEHEFYAEAFRELANHARLVELMHYHPVHRIPEYCMAGVAFLKKCGVAATEREVLLCAGSQHGITLAFGGLVQAGDVILMENLTYPAAKSVAALFKLQMHGLSMDSQGIIPEALESACRNLQPKLLYTIPTIQNPTTATQSQDRRRKIVDICRRHNLVIVEDDINALLPEEKPAPLTALYPEKSVYIANLSKGTAPGLRIAYLRAPGCYRDRLMDVIQATVWMISPLGARLATDWINNGRAFQLVEIRRQEARRRQILAQRILGDFSFSTQAFSNHLWLQLPEPWRAEDFVLQAQRRHVLVAAAEVFAVGRTMAPHAVRVSLGGTQTIGQLEEGLEILAQLLHSLPMSHGSCL